MQDLGCFSFLSALRVLCIENYPQPNSGTLVSDVLGTITPDAPTVALLAASLGLSVGFVSNDVGDDLMGHQLLKLLADYHILTTVTSHKNTTTPFTVGLYDQQENRTWFSFLPNITEKLSSVDLEILGSSKMVYIDAYAILSEVTPRVIDYVSRHQIPLFVNLGGDPLTGQMAQILRASRVAVLQTGITPSFQGEPEQYMRELQAVVQPDLTVVTLGNRGALCMTETTLMHIAAYSLQIVHTDGAGAAFSAGLAYALLHEWELERSMIFASALGGLYCTEHDGFGKFPRDRVLEFIQANVR